MSRVSTDQINADIALELLEQSRRKQVDALIECHFRHSRVDIKTLRIVDEDPLSAYSDVHLHQRHRDTDNRIYKPAT